MIDTTKPHHAYVCFGDIQKWKTEIQELFPTSNGWQSVSYDFEKLGVNEIKQVQEILQQKRDQRIVVITAERVSFDGQGTLLKLLEEPAPGTHIFLLFPNHVDIFDTIRSRVIVLDHDQLDTKNAISPVKDFLWSTVSERLDMIETLVKSRGKDESLQAYEVHQFIDALESGLYIVFTKQKRPLMFEEYFSAIRDARGWAAQTSFPMKNIIEYLAMVLPVFGRK